MTKYGYARVSTQGQELDAQIERLECEGCEIVFREKFTGTTKDRPQLQMLLSTLREGDTLIVTKLDRLVRSAIDGISLVRELIEKGVRVHILNMGLLDGTPTGRLLVTVLSGFAEFERDMIVERMAEGKAVARQREGYREGRKPKYTREQLGHAMYLKQTHSFSQVVELTGIPIATLKRESKRIKDEKENI